MLRPGRGIGVGLALGLLVLCGCGDQVRLGKPPRWDPEEYAQRKEGMRSQDPMAEMREEERRRMMEAHARAGVGPVSGGNPEQKGTDEASGAPAPGPAGGEGEGTTPPPVDLDRVLFAGTVEAPGLEVAEGAVLIVSANEPGFRTAVFSRRYPDPSFPLSFELRVRDARGGAATDLQRLEVSARYASSGQPAFGDPRALADEPVPPGTLGLRLVVQP